MEDKSENPVIDQADGQSGASLTSSLDSAIAAAIEKLKAIVVGAGTPAPTIANQIEAAKLLLEYKKTLEPKP
jgi:hypothetical protein